MSNERELGYLLDIYLEATHIVEFVGEIDTFEKFQKDILVQHAVARCFEIIGEAVKHLSLEFQMAHPAIDWSGYARMRDVLIHQYRKVDLSLIWQPIRDELPDLIVLLKTLLPPDPDKVVDGDAQS